MAGGSLSELLEREKMVCRRVTQSEACLVTSVGCRRLKSSWPQSVYKMEIEHMHGWLDADDGFLLFLYVTLIVVSRQFDGGFLRFFFFDSSGGVFSALTLSCLQLCLFLSVCSCIVNGVIVC